MNQKQVVRNAIAAVMQVIISSFILFVLYRYLLRSIGVEKLGIWSLVLASASVTRAADLGISGSIVKFVAKYTAYEDAQSVSKIIQTTLITIGIFIGIIVFLVYLLAPIGLKFVLDSSAIPDALSILPYAALSLWLAMIFKVYVGVLDGLQRIDLRAGIMILGAVLQLGLSVFFVPQLELIGLAIAQVIQYVILIIISLFVLRRLIHLPVIPYQWNRPLFKEMLSYGFNFQLIGIMAMLYDPLTKGMLSNYGGLEMLGYYEVASRFVAQVRTLIASANQVLVGTIASLNERMPDKIGSLYHTSVKVVIFLTIPAYVALIMISPILSTVLLGSFELVFIVMLVLLSIAWSINTLCGPAYVVYLGIGKLRWNTIVHILMAILNISLGVFLGSLFGGIGVVLGWVASLICGSLLLIVAFSIEQKERWDIYVTLPNLLLMIGALCSIFLTIALYFVLADSSWVNQSIAIGVCFTVCMSFPLWRHPVRNQLQLYLQKI